jgi:DeoR family transcriptional regulator, fructose operon transcriptional repressor
LLLCGGQVRAGDAACYGARADQFFGEFYADQAFLGSGGVHAEAGLTDYHPHEVATRRVIIAHAGASYVLADSSKLGAVALHRVCSLSQVTAIITDSGADPGIHPGISQGTDEGTDSEDPQAATKEAASALQAAGCTVLQAT